MANAVYDPETDEDKPVNDGSHDDLGMSDEERKAQIDDLERNYSNPTVDEPGRGNSANADAAKESKSTDPEAIKKAEAKAAQNSDEPSLGLVGGTERFFNPDKDKPKRRFNLRTATGQFTPRGRLAIGAGGGLIGLAVFGVTLFSFLNVFKLDHILKNIDAKTFARYNAQFANRSNSYLKAYIRIRMLEFSDATGHYGDKDGNIFFRSNEVNTGNKLADWYATMRTSNFEKDLAQQDGIIFSSSVDKEGHIHPAKIILKGEVIYPSEVSPQVQNAYSDVAKAVADGRSGDVTAAVNRFGPEMDKFVDTQLFNSDKEARKEIKQAVNNRTRFFQFLTRRRLRKNIQNMIGVRDWTFFEKTLASYEEKKTNIQQKIISKIFPDNQALANLLECIFTGQKCNVNKDIAHEEATSENLPNEANSATNETTDKNGKPVTTTEGLNGGQAASDLEQGIKDTASADTTKEEVTNWQQRIVKLMIEKFIGPEAANAASASVNPSAWWKWAKRIAAIQHMVSNKTFSKMVSKARLQQAVAALTILQIANSQMHTGQNSAKEVNQLMGTVSGFDNSEGWLQVEGKTDSLKAAAAATDPQPARDKNEYCNGDHVKLRNEFAWACDDIKPNGGSTAGDLESAWNSTVGVIAAPITKAVDAIQSIPIVSTISNFTDSIVGAISDATITPLLNSTGLTKSLGSVMLVVMQKVLTFAGVAPAWTGTEPGIANLATIGDAGLAESSARAAGGVVSTKSTLNYSNQVASAYEKNQVDSQSAFDRYASINNPDSLAAKSLFNVSSMSLTGLANSFANIFGNLSSVFSNIFTGRMFAADTPQPASSIADWAGVDKYDIPPQCQSLDPFDPQYTYHAVGVQQDSKFANKASEVLSNIRSKLTIDNERDDKAFWKIVYDEIGTRPDSEDIAGAIYNCALLDRQVEGGMGSLYGYTDDGGLNAGPTAADSGTGTTATGSVYWIGDSLSVGMNGSGQLSQKLTAAGLTPTQVEATVGINVGASVPKLQADAANVKSAANVVVELGTNNCSLGGNPSCMSTDAFQGQISGMVSAIRAINPTAKIYWVNIYTTKGPVYQTINQALANLSGSLNYKVIDWAGEVTSHPGKYNFDSQLGVHLTGNGYSDMAQFVVGGLK